MKCRACGEEIDFIRTKAGKMMPVDGREQESFHVILGDAGDPQLVVFTADGVTFRGKQVSRFTNGATVIKGYIPHWSTCTHPEQFRTSRP